MKRLTLVLFALLCPFGQAQSHDTRLMTPAEYKDFLYKVESALPKWEAGLNRVDPAKSNVSYAVGKQIEQYRDLSLKEATWVRQYLGKERAKHTVTGELALRGFLEGVFNTMDNIVQTEISAGITLSDLEKYSPEVSALIIRVANDATARVELLEKGTCP